MVSVDSRRVSRAPRYSGVRFESRSLSPTRLSRSMASLSREVRLMTGLVTLLLRILQPLNHLIHSRHVRRFLVFRFSFLGFFFRFFEKPETSNEKPTHAVSRVNKVIQVWAVPSSLATTIGIEVSFF